jgi:hypothetical protein
MNSQAAPEVMMYRLPGVSSDTVQLFRPGTHLIEVILLNICVKVIESTTSVVKIVAHDRDVNSAIKVLDRT